MPHRQTRHRVVAPRYVLSLIEGDGQTASVLATVATAPKVRVLDGAGLAVVGVPIVWTIGSDGQLDAGGVEITKRTDASGYSTVAWALSPTSGGNTLTAALAITGRSITFGATGTATAAAIIITNSAASQSGSASTTVTTIPSVLVTDAQGNPVSGTAITWAVVSGGGAVNTTGATTTDANGLATLTSWTLGASVGANTITATAAGLSGSPVTFTANAVGSAPTQIAVTSGGAQAGTVAGQAAASPIVVTVKDGSNVAVQGVTVTITTSSGSLSAASGVTDASGQVSVTHTTAVLIATATITLSFAKADATIVSTTTTSASTFGAATQLALTTQPSTTGTSGVVLSTQPVVEAQDANTNRVTTKTGTVTITVLSGNCNIMAGSTKALSSGVASFTGFTVSDADAGTNIFRFSLSGLTPVDSSGSVFVAPIALALAMTTQPNSVTTGIASLGAVVRIIDLNGTTVPGAADAVTVALTTPGGATLSGTLTVVAVNGVATFSGLAVDTNGSYTLTFTSGTLTPVVSASFSASVAGAVYVNQPSGHTTVHEFFHDKTAAALGGNTMHTVAGVTGMIYVSGNYANLHQLATPIDDTGAPFGVSQVGRTRFGNGATYNGTAANNLGMWSAAAQTVFYANEIYICHIFKIVGDGTAYENNAGGTKWGWFHSGHSLNNAINFLWLNNNGAGVQQRETQWKFLFKQQGGDNPGPGIMGQINRSQNNGFSGTYRLQLNTWHRVEQVAHMNTLGSVTQTGSGTAATFRGDGTYDLYVSDWTGSDWTSPDHIMAYTDLCYRRTGSTWDRTFGFAYWNPTYGGGSTIPLSQNNDIYHARWFVSGK